MATVHLNDKSEAVDDVRENPRDNMLSVSEIIDFMSPVSNSARNCADMLRMKLQSCLFDVPHVLEIMGFPVQGNFLPCWDISSPYLKYVSFTSTLIFWRLTLFLERIIFRALKCSWKIRKK